MDELRLDATIHSLVGAIGDVGKTKIQKMTYLLQEIYGVGLDCNFYLHQYGPYSDEVDCEVDRLSVMGYLTVDPDPDGYGYHVRASSDSDDDWSEIEKSIATEMTDLVSKVGAMDAWELEAVSTICFLDRQGLSKEKVVSELVRIKPRFKLEYVNQTYDRIREFGFLTRRPLS